MTRRLLASYLTLAVVILVALSVPLVTSFERGERGRITMKIERDAVALASLSEDALEQQPGLTALPTVEQFVRENLVEDERVVIVRADGTSVVDTSGETNRDFATREEFRTALSGEHTSGSRFSRDLDMSIFYVAVPITGGAEIRGAVRITFPTSSVDAQVRRVWIILAALGIFVLAVVALVGLAFARSIAGPLARVERASVAAGEGDLTVRAPVTGPPEVQTLASRFNQMVGRVEELVREREAFVADASHQLRTPLAAMRLRLENLEAGASREDREDLEAAIAEVDRLNRLVDGLLVLSRPTGDPAPAEPIEMCRLVSERVDLWSALAEEQGVTVSSDVSEQVFAGAASGRLEQVVDNLIENALEATPRGGSITVSARRRVDGGAEVEVVDTGRGMTDQERARAFDRFWRSERNPTDGTGLGLAIVRRLVEADGGVVTLHEAPTGGLGVLVRYPPPPGTRVPASA